MTQQKLLQHTVVLRSLSLISNCSRVVGRRSELDRTRSMFRRSLRVGLPAASGHYAASMSVGLQKGEASRLAAADSSSRAMRFGMMRALLRAAPYYDEHVLPFLKTVPPAVFSLSQFLCPSVKLADMVCGQLTHDKGGGQPPRPRADCLQVTPAASPASTRRSIDSPTAPGLSSFRRPPQPGLSFGPSGPSSIPSRPAPPTTSASLHFPCMRELIRHAAGDEVVGAEALARLHLLDRRLRMTDHKSLSQVPYQFEVGEIVRHSQLHQVGVIAARLPVCLESDEWMQRNLGSLEDERMRRPWYLILVAHHVNLPMDFVRYGSELTHVREAAPRGILGTTTMTAAASTSSDDGSSSLPFASTRPLPPPSIGFHRWLPAFFSSFDAASGRYLTTGAAAPPLLQNVVDVSSPPSVTNSCPPLAIRRKTMPQQLQSDIKSASVASSMRVAVITDLPAPSTQTHRDFRTAQRIKRKEKEIATALKVKSSPEKKRRSVARRVKSLRPLTSTATKKKRETGNAS